MRAAGAKTSREEDETARRETIRRQFVPQSRKMKGHGEGGGRGGQEQCDVA